MAERTLTGPVENLDWTRLPQVPVHSANVLVVHGTEEGHVLNFGYISPPIEPQGGSTTRFEDLQVQVVARLLLSQSVAQRVAASLQNSINNWQSADRAGGSS